MGGHKGIEGAFKDSESRFRGMPFWAWNGKLDPEILKGQIRAMKRMGLGGFFMHSRVGLATSYLSDEWFDCVRACVEEARRLGMLAWIYDEDRWPSGAAGGLVTRDPRWRRRALVMERHASVRKLSWTPDLAAAFTARVSGASASAVRRLKRGAEFPRPADGETLLVFRVKPDACEDWFNGYTYLDTLNPQAVRRFMEVTHEKYAALFGRDFGGVIPGIFSDEPHRGGVHQPGAAGSFGGIPWTGALPAAFKKRHGYDILQRLPELFLDVDGAAMTPARLDYHDCVTALFVDSFSRQVGEWCAEHGMLFTGHVLAEDTLSSQTRVVGSAMRFYERMQAPGMDFLTERKRIYTTAKQVSSAARQFGRTWRLSESYGCTGWDFPFAGHKALGDWQAALGINLRCQHLYWYTMEGQAKRDYPAAISPQSPWWESYRVVEDYFARLHDAVSAGEEARDVLVIHPVESMWSMTREGWLAEERVREYDLALQALEGTLLAAHIDFDYGDEEILGRLSSVKKSAAGTMLAVGRAVYAAVVVPPLLTMRASTLGLLRRFQAAGGLVVFAGEPPVYVGGAPSPDAAGFADSCVRTPASGPVLVRALEKTRRVSIMDSAGREIPQALYLLKGQKDRFCLFVCNTGVDPGHSSGPLSGGERLPRAAELDAAFPIVGIRGFAGCEGAPVELDLSTGIEYKADAVRNSDGTWEIHTSLARLGSRLFIISRKSQARRLPRRGKTLDAEIVELPSTAWDISLTEPNVLVLDRPSFRISRGGWEAQREILRVDAEVRKALGLTRRGGRMVQPWARGPLKKKSVPVELRYVFEAVKPPDRGLLLALERPGAYRILLNGREISPEPECGWWVDPSLKTLPVDPSLVRRGENTLVLECSYDGDHPGLEIVYLLGDFGVDVRQGRPELKAAPRTLAIGDWTAQGLPFYAGSVTYKKTLRICRSAGGRFFLQAPAYAGTAVRFFVDGKPVGLAGWEPHEADLTDHLPDAEADVELGIQVIGHRRNSHGPLHHAEKWPSWTGPDQFVTQGEDWREEYNLVPCGLMAEPRIIRRTPA